MAFHPSRLASAAAMAAALSMAATPAAAAELPHIAIGDAQVQTGDAGELNNHRYRRYRHRRDRGIDAGDVVAGVVVLGALAAIIGSSRSRDRDRDRDYRREDARYDRRDRGYESRGVESAVDMCIDQVEYRDNRVESVDQANRDTSGWNVSGRLDNGERWSCWIDNGGEIRRIDYGEVDYSQVPGAAAPGASQGQLSDAAYARARATTTTPADQGYSYPDTPTAPAAGDPRPAYPGGPLPGEEGYDANWQVDGDLEGDSTWEGDGRYSTAEAPDFRES
ncbi:hypothetical protein OZN62_13825 [Aurantiacibacter sp. MUD11]|uniref:hypothetical protein n=1 Tax=Aurantiacibacter sp. MUD11 TaxID=3003265 RepID=UPI0022AA6006|nr:hypothetical protein [Aurantiacibacter sp. MUD11]WAT17976.1 hypothetical protein OZN62_13825 [Aurantiacibacter sp. MUD11]